MFKSWKVLGGTLLALGVFLAAAEQVEAQPPASSGSSTSQLEAELALLKKLTAEVEAKLKAAKSAPGKRTGGTGIAPGGKGKGGPGFGGGWGKEGFDKKGGFGKGGWGKEGFDKKGPGFGGMGRGGWGKGDEKKMHEMREMFEKMMKEKFGGPKGEKSPKGPKDGFGKGDKRGDKGRDTRSDIDRRLDRLAEEIEAIRRSMRR